MLFYRENDRRMGEVAKRPPLYMATYGKQKMRSNMFPSASARGEYFLVLRTSIIGTSFRLLNYWFHVLFM